MLDAVLGFVWILDKKKSVFSMEQMDIMSNVMEKSFHEKTRDVLLLHWLLRFILTFRFWFAFNSSIGTFGSVVLNFFFIRVTLGQGGVRTTPSGVW